MRRDYIEDGVAYFSSVTVAVEIFNVRPAFDTIVPLVVKLSQCRKRTMHPNAGQHKITGSAGAEIEISRFVKEDISAVVHHVAFLNWL